MSNFQILLRSWLRNLLLGKRRKQGSWVERLTCALSEGERPFSRSSLLSLRGVGNMSDNYYIWRRKHSMASIRSSSGLEIEDRVFMLSQKINSFKLTKPEEPTRRCDRIDNLCDQIESDLEAYTQRFSERVFDSRHLLSKISKELQIDYPKTDSFVRQQIQNAHSKLFQLIQQHTEQRKATDEKMVKSFDQQAAALRDTVESEARDRQATAVEIEQSLSVDMGEIRQKLQEAEGEIESRLDKVRSSFEGRLGKVQQGLKETCDSYCENESDFYRMLRDLVKKVKSQLVEHQAKREAMEEEILGLIEKMCDNAIEGRPLIV